MIWLTTLRLLKTLCLLSMKVTNSEYGDYGPSEFTVFRPQQPEIIAKANSRTGLQIR